jgi:hypothetical protein
MSWVSLLSTLRILNIVIKGGLISIIDSPPSIVFFRKLQDLGDSVIVFRR